MGHRFSDLDCIGAAIGMQSVMEKSFNLYSKIVVDKTKTMAEKLIDYAEKNIGKDIFITPDEAMKQVTPKTLLIIVDTHLRNSLESPQLYDECKKVIVIDHHRRAVNYIDNALVFCHEPFASSACEMCSEIISCIDDKAIGYAQADALLAGIMLDTKNFVLKTGVRTFEAAAYLRRRGATTINVKQMFSDSIETYREKVSIVCDAKIYRNCAISIAKGADGDVRLASAQAADELLTLENVKASFVIYESGGKICISARSFGAVNVQIIMEKLGGGGHQTMSATQLSDINKDKKVNEITKQERLGLVHLIKNLEMTVTGTRGFNEAIITQGGVNVKEINPSTMESKLVQNVYFAGEVLDVDAVTGGFNLQVAWSSAYAAASHLE